jgi:hypothetical protein
VFLLTMAARWQQSTEEQYGEVSRRYLDSWVQY